MRRLPLALTALLLVACLSRPAPPHAGSDPLKLHLDRQGTIRLDGKTADPERVRATLAAYADTSREEDGWRLSNREVLLVVDPATPYRAIRAALQLCTRRDVLVWKIGLRVGDRTERIELCGMFVRSNVWVHVPVLVDPVLLPASADVEVEIFDEILGRGEAGFAELETRGRRYLFDDPTLPTEIDAAPEIAARHVVRLLEALRRAGYSPPRVRGVPPADEYEWARREVNELVSTHAGAELLDRLEALARSADRATRASTFEALSDLGAPAIPCCARLLREQDPRWALWTLRRIGEETGADLTGAWPAILETVRRESKDREALFDPARDIAEQLGPAALAELDAALGSPAKGR